MVVLGFGDPTFRGDYFDHAVEMFIGLLKVLGVSGEVAELFGGGVEDGTGRNLSHCTF